MFKVGDRVVVTDDYPDEDGLNGRVGTVVHIDQSNLWPIHVNIDNLTDVVDDTTNPCYFDEVELRLESDV